MNKSQKKSSPQLCGCGCGKKVKGALFARGHKNRHKSDLIKALCAGGYATARVEELGWNDDSTFNQHLKEYREGLAKKPLKVRLLSQQAA